MNRFMVKGLAGVAALLGAAAWASADTFTFSRIENNAGQNVAAQLFADVIDAGPSGGYNRVDFIFRNEGPTGSVISEIYFDDGTLLGISEIIGSPSSVDFSRGAVPENLPGGQNVSPTPFVSSVTFSASADNPAPHNGVGPGGRVTIRFNLLTGKTFADTLLAIAQGVDVGGVEGLRMGLHVTGIGQSDSSDSFVNTQVVPLPMAAWMGLTLMGCVGGVGYFRKRRNLGEMSA